MDFDPGIFTPNDNASGLGQTRIGGGIRLSAVNAFNLGTYELAYKIRGGDPTPKINETWDDDNTTGNFQPDGEGVMTHVAGLYFNLPNMVPDLGIGIGFTTLFRTYEDEVTGSPANPNRYFIETKSPFFTGADLFLRYSGIQDFRFTIKNNVSFANIPQNTYDADNNIILQIK
jgi:hypothetical protein